MFNDLIASSTKAQHSWTLYSWYQRCGFEPLAQKHYFPTSRKWLFRAPRKSNWAKINGFSETAPDRLLNPDDTFIISNFVLQTVYRLWLGYCQQKIPCITRVTRVTWTWSRWDLHKHIQWVSNIITEAGRS
jgi:hypothetical protein